MNKTPDRPGQSAHTPACLYCASTHTFRKYQDLYHLFAQTYGPFDFYQCLTCGAGSVSPMPTDAQLAALYSQYKNGMYEEFSKDTEEAQWHKELAETIGNHAKRHFAAQVERIRWIDMGAGSGAIALRLAEALPHSDGYCSDLHARPASLLTSNLQWIQKDFVNFFYGNADYQSKFDLIYCSAVLEHVKNPAQLIETALGMAKPGGLIYFMCPDFGSVASRVMGTRWPYFIIGEHLSIPTVRSIQQCLARQQFSGKYASFKVKRTLLHYNLRYVLRALRLPLLSKLIPSTWRLGLPTGILEFVMVKK